jgi:hypothetical protein
VKGIAGPGEERYDRGRRCVAAVQATKSLRGALPVRPLAASLVAYRLPYGAG